MSTAQTTPTLSEALKAERKRLGITAGQAAIILEVSQSIVEKWESGARSPLEITKEGALARLRGLEPSHPPESCM